MGLPKFYADDNDPEYDQLRLKWLRSVVSPSRSVLTYILEKHGQDVIMKSGSVSFRYGYFNGNTFRRENPIRRSMNAHLARPSGLREGALVWGKSEPQYDLLIEFNWDGTVKEVVDLRTAQEVD